MSAAITLRPIFLQILVWLITIAFNIFAYQELGSVGSKAIKAVLLPSVDKTMTSYIDKFKQFKKDLQMSTFSITGITVCRIVGEIQAAGIL